MKKLLVIGMKGMAGHMLYQYFKEKKAFDVYGVARNVTPSNQVFDIDVTNTSALQQLLAGHQFDYVVNCIGVLNKDAEDHPAKATWLNSYFPHFLEEQTKGTSIQIIHISTDCVFSGKEGGYTEKDFKNGIGFYAQSKALGEVNNEKDLTIRTSIIGPELNQQGIGLFHWFMSQPSDAKLKGYSQAFWSGITTLELAKVIIEAINEQISGLIQVAPREKIDKYSLISLFNKTYRENEITISSDDNYKVDKSLVSIRDDFGYRVPTYQVMLDEQKSWMLDHPEMYPHYRISPGK